ncbi:hypothetical protein P153DRAFT_405810 [Dothidotthia symphoricarpi CBS 119687]|uniref:Uncharacterized protein n=1 Tax=Dothidotthia symphoricarpi CBS 119687 TaxID=1392245 RepID=A0A6A6AAB3_9PLEO|nr:uncharacterized protein P153DRAFT_405810 [Dothidotthia symphoricarpi CBS 119687]KAF2127621.1 hypothetical protein P153DRAFT_405810 [Dothidotthia symphoricarpi CBS 119687]
MSTVERTCAARRDQGKGMRETIPHINRTSVLVTCLLPYNDSNRFLSSSSFFVTNPSQTFILHSSKMKFSLFAPVLLAALVASAPVATPHTLEQRDANPQVCKWGPYGFKPGCRPDPANGL